VSASSPPGPRRWHEQRWAIDVAIRTDGLEWDQPRVGYTLRPIGPDGAHDFAWAQRNIRQYDDITPVFRAVAERREERGREAERAGRLVTAREHYFIASAHYLSAAWPIFEHSPLLLELNDRKNACYARWAALAPHRVERVEIPFEDGILPAWFHMPRDWDGASPVPTALICGGMDAFKEIQVSMYGDKLLERGFAVLAVDGPGQGEAPIHRVFVTERNWIDAGEALMDWLLGRSGVDADRLVAFGLSFGSFWMTQVAATQPRLKGCAVGLVCHEPGGHAIFEQASPTFKARYMWMANLPDEDEFDRFAAKLDLDPLVADMSVPWLSVAGDNDELSPIEHTYALAASCGAPAPLLVYENERHALSGAPSTVLGPNWLSYSGDWLLDRVQGKPVEERFEYVTHTGAVEVRPHPRSWSRGEEAAR
jgi:pimeloyl-ACP methyl ester carboxylesterase